MVKDGEAKTYEENQLYEVVALKIRLERRHIQQETGRRDERKRQVTTARGMDGKPSPIVEKRRLPEEENCHRKRKIVPPQRLDLFAFPPLEDVNDQSRYRNQERGLFR